MNCELKGETPKWQRELGTASADCAPAPCSALAKEFLRLATIERKQVETAKDERYINWIKGRESAFQESAVLAEGKMPNADIRRGG